MKNKKYYSQFEEDKILEKIFNKDNGVCVEVGGFDGVTGSNTFFFEKLGWRCLVIEPMPDFCEKIKALRTCEIAEVAASHSSGSVEFHVAVGVETLSTIEVNTNHFDRIKSLSQHSMRKIIVNTERLDDILLKHGFCEVDFITIDVEGHESSVLAGMSFESISPRIVIIEDNSNGSDHRVKELMHAKSYVRFKKTGCNDWYTKKNDPLATFPNVIWTEIMISLYVLKQKIKPFVPAFLKTRTA